MEVCGDTRRNVQELKISVRDSGVANETTGKLFIGLIGCIETVLPWKCTP